MLVELDDAERATSQGTVEPHGTLSVTAPVAFGSLFIRPILEDFLETHRSVRGRLLLLDRVVSLVEEGVDVSVRIGHLPDSALIAIDVGRVRRVLVASPAYLARHGRPKTPQDLTGHRLIAATSVTPHDSWSFSGKAGARALRVRVDPLLTVNVPDAAIRSAATGIGIACVISYQVTEQLATGSLVRLLTAFEPPPLPVHLLYPASSARTAKVRAFVESAAPRLRTTLAAAR
ncbi:MAG TPA: LysR substrate-binding domain-containing protein [Polyangiaceae bacterium]|nr:LysR substrate-binding domain-containing protein [Polyangiaceae bacterium]